MWAYLAQTCANLDSEYNIFLQTRNIHITLEAKTCAVAFLENTHVIMNLKLWLSLIW